MAAEAGMNYMMKNIIQETINDPSKINFEINSVIYIGTPINSYPKGVNPPEFSRRESGNIFRGIEFLEDSFDFFYISNEPMSESMKGILYIYTKHRLKLKLRKIVHINYLLPIFKDNESDIPKELEEASINYALISEIISKHIDKINITEESIFLDAKDRNFVYDDISPVGFFEAKKKKFPLTKEHSGPFVNSIFEQLKSTLLKKNKILLINGFWFINNQGNHIKPINRRILNKFFELCPYMIDYLAELNNFINENKLYENFIFDIDVCSFDIWKNIESHSILPFDGGNHFDYLPDFISIIDNSILPPYFTNFPKLINQVFEPSGQGYLLEYNFIMPRIFIPPPPPPTPPPPPQVEDELSLHKDFFRDHASYQPLTLSDFTLLKKKKPNDSRPHNTEDVWAEWHQRRLKRLNLDKVSWNLENEMKKENEYLRHGQAGVLESKINQLGGFYTPQYIILI